MRRYLIVLGTRPEIIKLAPVVHAVRTEAREEAVVVHTGQHLDLARPMLDIFGIVPDHALEVMSPNQDLFTLSSRLLERMGGLMRGAHFDAIFVQGDTTSAFLGALAGYYTRTPVAHVEAGLRTTDKWHPYPEEINRRLAGVLADFHFPPTERARANLVREGIDAQRIAVTGNTVIDALQWALTRPHEVEQPALRRLLTGSGRWALVTTHRRENFGEPHRQVFSALLTLVERFADLSLLFPVHPNPSVRAEVEKMLHNHPRIHLCAPLGYLDFLQAMQHCTLILTDSGGVQEEAPTLRKPVLVLRDETERPEGLETGALELVGTDAQRIVTAASRLLTDPAAVAAMTSRPNPYGDGRAATRIVEQTRRWLTEGLPHRI